jgi:outer membrane protein assembly factor BamB
MIRAILRLGAVYFVMAITVHTTRGDALEPSWPTFRGPDRTAVAPDTDLLTAWPEEGPPLIWQANGAGRGYSSLAIANGRIYTLGDAPSTADDEDEYLVCFDQSTGDQLWKAKTGSAWTSGQPNWQSSRSTPTVAADHVYVLTAHGKLICFDQRGQEVWQKDMKEDLQGKKGDGWGYSESVLIDGDRLVATPGGEENTMVALHKETGERLWSASRKGDEGAGHSSIVISEIGGTKVYVATTNNGAMGVRAEDGKLLWSYEAESNTATIPTPIVRDDLVFFTAGYQWGGTLLRQVAGEDGEISVEEVYPLQEQLKNKHGGIVLVGDYLYGDSDDKATPFCAELMTGEVKWKSRGSGSTSACLAAADGHLYIRYGDGTMALAKATPEAFEEVGSFEIPGSGERPSWSHPVILDGKLYLREGDLVLCYDLREHEG